MKVHAWFVALLVMPLVAVADVTSITVYRTVGSDGVVRFSDEHTEGATAVELESIVPHPEDVERADDLYEQQLALIGVLESDRRATEAAAAERRQTELELARARAAWDAREAVEMERRYVYAPWYAPRPYLPYPPHHGGHGHDDPPPPPGKPDPRTPSNSRPLGIGSR